MQRFGLRFFVGIVEKLPMPPVHSSNSSPAKQPSTFPVKLDVLFAGYSIREFLHNLRNGSVRGVHHTTLLVLSQNTTWGSAAHCGARARCAPSTTWTSGVPCTLFQQNKRSAPGSEVRLRPGRPMGRHLPSGLCCQFGPPSFPDFFLDIAQNSRAWQWLSSVPVRYRACQASHHRCYVGLPMLPCWTAARLATTSAAVCHYSASQSQCRDQPSAERHGDIEFAQTKRATHDAVLTETPDFNAMRSSACGSGCFLHPAQYHSVNLHTLIALKPIQVSQHNIAHPDEILGKPSQVHVSHCELQSSAFQHVGGPLPWWLTQGTEDLWLEATLFSSEYFSLPLSHAHARQASPLLLRPVNQDV